MADDLSERAGVRVEARWGDLADVPIVLVNQAIGQVVQGSIVITLGRLLPPALLGSAEEKARQMEAIGHLTIVPVVSLTMSVSQLRAIRNALDETIAIYERQESSLELDDDQPAGDEGGS